MLKIETSDGTPLEVYLRVEMEFSDEQIKVVNLNTEYQNLDSILENACMNAKLNRLIAPSANKGIVTSYGNTIEVKSFIPVMNFLL